MMKIDIVSFAITQVGLVGARLGKFQRLVI